MANAMPLIGILSEHRQGDILTYYKTSGHYIEQVEAAGGIPVQLPVTSATGEAQLAAWVARCDGFLLPGGGDLPAALYGETTLAGEPEPDEAVRHRAQVEMALIRLAAEHNRPMLGICLGEQALNVALGGTLYQDLPSQRPSAVNHHQPEHQRAAMTHSVSVVPGSLLHRIVGGETLWVNTFHHQAVKTPAPKLTVSATASDGLTEAVEWPEKRILGVQWHPENLADAARPEAAALFRWLVREAGGTENEA